MSSMTGTDEDLKGVVDAINRSQATIEFKLDGTILTANENFLQAMGYSLQEIQGRHHSMFVEQSFRDSPSYRQFWDDLARGRFQAAEYKRLAKGGREVWIQASYNPILDASGKPYKVIKFATDITEAKLKSAEHEGQISAINRSQAVIEFKLDGTIITANPNFLAALGYSLQEIQGRHHSMFVEPSYRESNDYRRFWETLGRGQYQAAEYKRIAKGGREIFIQASYNPILDPSGRPYKVVKFATDVTEQVMARQAVQSTIASSAASVEELSASVLEIARNMAQSRESAEGAVAKTQAAGAYVQKLNSAAQSMTRVVDMINAITSQINLLALNATIESARAGEAGRGFAVVANEVKVLAGQARSATDSVAGEIRNMRSVSDDVTSALSEISAAIEGLSGFVGSTATAVEEQSVVTRDISESMQRASQEARALVRSAA